MARNGSGVYTPPTSDFPAVSGTLIESTKFNNTINDIATAITGSIAADGQTVITANLPMATYKLTGMGVGSARTDSITLGQDQDGKSNWVDGGGTADAITATYSPPITALVDGQLCFVRATAANATTTPTFAPNGLTARTIVQRGGVALVAGSIAGDGHELALRYDLSNTRWELLNPAVASGGGTVTGDITMSGASIIEAQGAIVVAAATTNIWATDGNYRRISGNATITSLGSAPQNGAYMECLIEDAPTLTHGGNIYINGNSSITLATGDRLFVRADSSGVNVVTVVKQLERFGLEFSAYPSGGQTVVSGVFTKVNFDTQHWDITSSYASARFTAQVAGYYEFIWKVTGVTNIANGVLLASLFFNGVEYARGSLAERSSGTCGSTGTRTALMAVGDYVEVYVFLEGTDLAADFAVSNYFQGKRLA